MNKWFLVIFFTVDLSGRSQEMDSFHGHMNNLYIKSQRLAKLSLQE